jgi:hypothetical protein
MLPGKPRSRVRVKDDSFAAVVRDYLNSPKFQAYSDGTRAAWRRELALASREDTLGALSVYVLRPALVQAFLDGLSDTPAKAMSAYTAIKQLEKWAIVRDRLPHQITLGIEVEGSDGGHEPWSDEHISVAEQHIRSDLVRFITLGANTGQRGSDLIKMRWDHLETVSGHLGVNVEQRKTGRKLWIPFTAPLLAVIDRWERLGPFIVPPRKFKPWSRTALSKAWARERDSNPNLEPHKKLGLVLHGLRATACVRLSRAGATTRQISDMVGMSEKIVASYCRLSAQQENALAAVIHLNRYLDRRTDQEQTKAGSE